MDSGTVLAIGIIHLRGHRDYRAGLLLKIADIIVVESYIPVGIETAPIGDSVHPIDRGGFHNRLNIRALRRAARAVLRHVSAGNVAARIVAVRDTLERARRTRTRKARDALQPEFEIVA